MGVWHCYPDEAPFSSPHSLQFRETNTAEACITNHFIVKSKPKTFTLTAYKLHEHMVSIHLHLKKKVFQTACLLS